MNLGYTARDAASTAAVGARGDAGRRACVPRDRVVHCLNYQLWTGGVTDHLILEAAGATVVPFGVGNTRGADRGDPRARRDRASRCTPSYPALLAKVLREETELRAARPRPAHRAVRRRGRPRQRRLPARRSRRPGASRCATPTSACRRCCRSSAGSARRRPTCTSMPATSCSPRSSTRARSSGCRSPRASTGELVCTHLAARVPAAGALPVPRHRHGHRHRALRLRPDGVAVPHRRPHGRHVQRARRERLPDRRPGGRRRTAGAAVRAPAHRPARARAVRPHRAARRGRRGAAGERVSPRRRRCSTSS